MEDVYDLTVPKSSAEVAPVRQEYSNYSLDQLVDRYLKQYEKESIPSSQTPSAKEQYSEGKLYKAYKYLLEADEPPAEEPAADPAAGGDMGDLGDLGGGDAGGAPAPETNTPMVYTPNLDIPSFGRSVARLMDNFESLLDPKTTIMNRAMLYLEKNYSPRHAQMLKQFLEQEFGYGLQQRKRDVPDSFAAGAMDTSGGAPTG